MRSRLRAASQHILSICRQLPIEIKRKDRDSFWSERYEVAALMTAGHWKNIKGRGCPSFQFQDNMGYLPDLAEMRLIDTGGCPRSHPWIDCCYLIRPDEIDNLVAEGLLSCADEALSSVQQLASRVLMHIRTSRCQKRVGITDAELRCRNVVNALA